MIRRELCNEAKVGDSYSCSVINTSFQISLMAVFCRIEIWQNKC